MNGERQRGRERERKREGGERETQVYYVIVTSGPIQRMQSVLAIVHRYCNCTNKNVV